MKLNTKAVNYWKKITSLAVVGSLLFGVVVPQISFASSFPLKKDYLREPLTFQLEKRKSNIYRTDENHRLRKDSGLREGGRFASEAQVLAMAAPYIPVDQFSKVSKEFSKSIKEQIHRDSLSSNQSLSKHIPTEHFPHTSNQLLSQTATQGNNDFPYTSNESLSQRGTESNKDFPSTIQSLANQVSDFVSRVSALHGGTEHDLSGLIVRKRAEHGLNITEEEWRRSEKFDLKPFNQFLSNYLEIYFDKYRVKEFEEMTTEELKEGKKPLTGEEKEMIREIELEFEEQANNAFRYVGVTRVKVGLWEGPGMVESEDAWIIAPVFITDRSETLDSKYVHYQRVRNETGKSFIHRGLIKQWLEIKKKYGEESMME
ncbi:MAG: hypothetical protein HYT97_06565 [Elusimicrobia bacterium]|nr:hypothetical protein [Elusimicrobiota bacterium]